MPLIATALRRLYDRLADERGVTMVTVMLTMLAVTAGGAATLVASGGDLNLAAHDDRSKRAYEAAEAGLHDYLFHLNQNNAYWALCTDVPPPARVSQAWNGTGPDTRAGNWRKLAGSSAEYAVELVPAPGRTACDPNDAQASMIDSQGMFRIRSTGRVPTAEGYAKRSIVAAFRRRGFIDYLYYTDFETIDPSWYEVYSRGRPTRRTQPLPADHMSLLEWASESCSRYYRPSTPSGSDGRGSQSWKGQIQWGTTTWSTWPSSGNQLCIEIQFAPGDVVKGPLHTNDEIMICNSPQFGRNAQDRIEVSAPTRSGFNGWRVASGCSNNPNFQGTFTANSPILAMPPTNTKLKAIADPNYTFTGRTTIKMQGGSLVITNDAAGLSDAVRAYPPNGVIYVQNGDCGQTTRPLDPLGTPAGCGDAYVQGSYGTDLTIATENDILVTEDVTRSGDRMLGLIANNYIRVHHPVANLNVPQSSSAITCQNDNALGDVRIDAAILSLTRSFTVDYFFCGAPLGDLTINGAIAQKFRGAVGQGSASSISNGYIKDYNYDDRLAYRSPPHFLDPVQSAWRLVRQTEQTPAR